MINVNKTIIEPISNGKIKVPAPKVIAYLKKTGTYETFTNFVKDQSEALKTNVPKIVIPAIIGVISLGTAVAEYAKAKYTNDKYLYDSELLVNEATEECDRKEKEEKESKK